MHATLLPGSSPTRELWEWGFVVHALSKKKNWKKWIAMLKTDKKYHLCENKSNPCEVYHKGFNTISFSKPYWQSTWKSPTVIILTHNPAKKYLNTGVVESSRLTAKIAAYLVSIGWLLCLAFLYGWRFLNKIYPDWLLTLTTKLSTSKLSDNPA